MLLTDEQLAIQRKASAIITECGQRLRALGVTPPYFAVLIVTKPGGRTGYHYIGNGLADLNNKIAITLALQSVLNGEAFISGQPGG